MKAFDVLIKDIQKLNDVNPSLCSNLRAYCYDIIGCCQRVHRELGPFLNEYIYQDALDIELTQRGYDGDDKIKEHYFTVKYHGAEIKHPHKVDFFVKKNVFIECKAVGTICTEHRQQLWNYMRLAHIRIGILYNFAPYHDQCERYYLDTDSQVLYCF